MSDRKDVDRWTDTDRRLRWLHEWMDERKDSQLESDGRMVQMEIWTER